MLGLLLPIQADWTLHYERSRFLETGRYEEALEYCRRLDAASPQAKLIRFGTSPEGRPLVALVLSKDNAFEAALARRSVKPLVLVVNGIHSGEIEGQDASLMLARDILITRKDAATLDHVNLMIVPVFNVDGHERFNAFNRINQNGPKEMGWRSNALNLNLNRDWIKADAPEMRHMLTLISKWQPDLAFDNHTTNGGDWQYSLMVGLSLSPTQHPGVATWTRAMFDEVTPRTNAEGFLTIPYFSRVSAADPSRGIDIGDFTPRFSQGYFAAINRPAILIETHMLKPYKTRVDATLSMMRNVLSHLSTTGRALKTLNAEADREWARPGPRVTLEAELTEEATPFVFKGYPYRPYRSAVSGGDISAWERVPTDFPSRMRNTYRASLEVEPPLAYAVPPRYKDVIDRLALHGIATTVLKKPLDGTFRTYRFRNVTFAAEPFEGRQMPRFRLEAMDWPEPLPPGTVMVHVAQPRGKLAMHLLEPAGPDSLVRWGFFNPIFEQKEYYEAYAFEPVAAKMLADDAALRAEFEERLKDPAFAGSPQARLDFLWERSPYSDERLRVYPVVRVER